MDISAIQENIIKLRPGKKDIVFIKTPQKLSRDVIEHLQADMSESLGVKVVVLDDGLDIVTQQPHWLELSDLFFIIGLAAILLGLTGAVGWGWGIAIDGVILVAVGIVSAWPMLKDINA